MEELHMAKSFFDFKINIFESLTEATALERRAEREQNQADMAKAAAEEDTRRRRAREARREYRRERKRALELGESFKPGDTVHLGHATKGGTGVIGKVVKVEGGKVHIKNDKGDTFKGPVSRATLKEFVELEEQRFSPAQLAKLKNEYGKITSVDPSQPTYKKLTSFLDGLSDEQLKQLAQAKIKFVSGLALNRVNRRKMQKESVELGEANAKEYRMDAPDSIKKAIEGGKAKILKTAPSYLGGKSVFAVIENPLAKGTQHDTVVMAIISNPSGGKIKLFRYFGSHPSPTGAMTFAKNNNLLESVELGEANMPKFDEVLRKGKKLGDWNMMSYFLYDGNVWMLKSGRAVNQGSLETFMKRSQSGLINSLKFESVQEEIGLPSDHPDHVELDEVSPPGFEGTVKAMKKYKDIDNPWALAWYMKNKGYKSHKTKDGKDK